MTVHDVRFSSVGAGINVCCMSPHVDPYKVYSAAMDRSATLTTFMQQDSLTMNLGYVTNMGYTDRLGEMFNIISQWLNF